MVRSVAAVVNDVDPLVPATPPRRQLSIGVPLGDTSHQNPPKLLSP